MKVYVVGFGNYEGLDIIAIKTDKDKANEEARIANDEIAGTCQAKCVVEEYEADEE